MWKAIKRALSKFACGIGLHDCPESMPVDPAECLKRDVLMSCRTCGVVRKMVGWKYGHSSGSIEDYYPYFVTVEKT